jgi:hypothetical protein
MNDNTLLSLSEVGRRTAISDWSLRREIRAGRLCCHRRHPRGKILISLDDLDAFLNAIRCEKSSRYPASKPHPNGRRGVKRHKPSTKALTV